MKTLIILLLFLSTLFSNTIKLDNDFEVIDTKYFSKIFVDKSAKLSFEEIKKNRDKLFKDSNKSKYTYSKSNIWVSFSIENVSNKQNNYILINTFFLTDEIDFYVIRDNKDIKVEYLGKNRAQELRENLTRHHQINLNLKSKEKVEIFIRFSSFSTINTNFKIFTITEAIKFYSIDSKIWGLLIGLLLTLIIYNSMVYLSLKDKAFLFYVLHGVSALILHLYFSGILYEYHFPVNNFTYYIPKVLPSIVVVFLSLFIIYFFNQKETMSIFYKINIFLIAFFGIFAFSVIFFKNNFILYNQLTTIFLFLFLIYFFTQAFVVLYKKLFGSLYFFLGTGLYALFSVFNISYTSSILLSENFIILYFVPIGITFDMLFLSMALGKRIALIEKKRKDNELLLNEHSKFITMGQILGGVIHQLRQPIVYIGTLLANLEAINFKRGSDEKELKIIDKIKKITQSMDKTIFDFYNFYAKDKNKNMFDVKEVVTDVIAILSPIILKNSVKVVNRVENMKINSYQNSLSHILIIIIENAIDIAKERKIKNPIIEVFSKKLNEKIEIYIKDNCGGVSITPIEKIFEPTISSKEKNSMGIGLTMAKNLVEKKLSASIEVRNIENGTEFIIEINFK